MVGLEDSTHPTKIPRRDVPGHPRPTSTHELGTRATQRQSQLRIAPNGSCNPPRRARRPMVSRGMAFYTESPRDVTTERLGRRGETDDERRLVYPVVRAA